MKKQHIADVRWESVLLTSCWGRTSKKGYGLNCALHAKYRVGRLYTSRRDVWRMLYLIGGVCLAVAAVYFLRYTVLYRPPAWVVPSLPLWPFTHLLPACICAALLIEQVLRYRHQQRIARRFAELSATAEYQEYKTLLSTYLAARCYGELTEKECKGYESILTTLWVGSNAQAGGLHDPAPYRKALQETAAMTLDFVRLSERAKGELRETTEPEFDIATQQA